MCLGQKIGKCEKIVENIFSIALFGTQPNTKKYFFKYFKKYNQTLKINLFSTNYFHLKIQLENI